MGLVIKHRAGNGAAIVNSQENTALEIIVLSIHRTESERMAELQIRGTMRGEVIKQDPFYLRIGEIYRLGNIKISIAKNPHGRKGVRIIYEAPKRYAILRFRN